ncbi:MAG: hydantoinase/oxoprolinase family protein [Pseudomonadota bacterium]
MKWVGIDVGGTFTDVVVYDHQDGLVRSAKRPTTPAEPELGVFEALEALAVDLPRVARFRHGATVATNTALERKGARIGVLTTRGFRDVLMVGRGNRLDLYNIKATRPVGLVERTHILEVSGRLRADGSEMTPLDENGVHDAARRFEAMGVDTVAVCFLHAYANGAHEARAASRLRDTLPGVLVCTSAEVLPEHREYERFATTALNAYVAPRMSGYLTRLADRLEAEGLSVSPEIMSSSGGSWSFARMARLPVNSMLSGPAGGVIGAVETCRALQLTDFITCDMGGTSTDVAMVRGGAYALSMEGTIGEFPNRVPQIEINTVGAGGGSLAYLDTGGFLNVGPRSAGAVPGPACYGRGGTEPTVTDANVVLGRLRPNARLGDRITLDVEAAERAVDALADRLQLDRMTTAAGIVRIANTRMTAAVKEISVMRGIDPRSFALVAFGGAGPLHAAEIAAELAMPQVIVPPLPGAFSAFGLLVAERRLDYSQAALIPLTDDHLADIRARLEAMEDTARKELADEGFGGHAVRIEHSLDIRFHGQAFELATPLTAGMHNAAAIGESFRAIYAERYSHADSGSAECVCLRLSAFGLGDKPAARTDDSSASGPSQTDVMTRTVYFDGGPEDARVLDRASLPPEARVQGPAVIEEPGAVTIVPPRSTARVASTGALILVREGEAGE